MYIRVSSCGRFWVAQAMLAKKRLGSSKTHIVCSQACCDHSVNHFLMFPRFMLQYFALSCSILQNAIQRSVAGH